MLQAQQFRRRCGCIKVLLTSLLFVLLGSLLSEILACGPLNVYLGPLVTCLFLIARFLLGTKGVTLNQMSFGYKSKQLQISVKLF